MIVDAAGYGATARKLSCARIVDDLGKFAIFLKKAMVNTRCVAEEASNDSLVVDAKGEGVDRVRVVDDFVGLLGSDAGLGG